MKGIPSDLYERLRIALLRCGPFSSDQELRATFIDARLNPWRHDLPEARSRNERVKILINYLYEQYTSTGENALFLLLRVLVDRTSRGDACFGELSRLAKELERVGAKSRYYDTSAIYQVAGIEASQIGVVGGDANIVGWHINNVGIIPTKPNKKILIVDDEPHAIIGVVDRLENLHYDVITAPNGLEGIKKVRSDKPDLVLLDITMPKMDGLTTCRFLKSLPETRDIPILMLTARGRPQDKAKGLNMGADDYLDKPFEMVELVARVQALLRRTESTPFQSNNPNQCFFSISCESQRWINVQGKGAAVFNISTQRLLNIDVNRYGRKANNAFAHDGRFERKDLGKELYTLIFLDHPEVSGSYNQSLGVIDNERYLHLRFMGNWDFFKVPFEFMFDIHQREYLVLKYPLARTVTGNGIGIARRGPLSPTFFNRLFLDEDKLRVLLIASNTGSPLAAVDEEIKTLKEVLQALFTAKRIQVEIKALDSDEATYENVKRELKHNNYHIIHYAGHGAYDEDSPELSYLSFWEENNHQGKVKNMSATTLQNLLKDSLSTRFVYLSCCEGTLTGQSQDFLEDDFLGLADAIVKAGVPSLLGYRHPVEDTSAKKMAVAFYTYLAEYGEIDTALLDARCEIAGEDRDDPAWISPILIMQE